MDGLKNTFSKHVGRHRSFGGQFLYILFPCTCGRFGKNESGFGSRGGGGGNLVHSRQKVHPELDDTNHSHSDEIVPLNKHSKFDGTNHSHSDEIALN